jgi:two-component system sensor histidine kinase MprB
VTFRVRVTIVAAAAVAISVIVAAALLYLAVQRQLIGQLDETLVASARGAQEFGARVGPRSFLGGVRVPLLAGRPDLFAQLVDSSGDVVAADGEPIQALVTPEVVAIARGQRGASFADIEIQGTRLRIYTVPFRGGLALELARPRDEVDAALAETRRTLLAVALGGVLLAAFLGAFVAREALVPITRLSATVEDVTRTRDLSRRVGAGGADELGRLAASFDAMLVALEASVRAQRQLVADASHELRTPLTSLRTNLELLARGQPADPEERERVLVDLVAQIERLTTLVADLIDLAREDEMPLLVEDVRLDELVAQAVDDVRGRYPKVPFRLEGHPTSVRGVRSRIARAVTNLLDNAAKWSATDGVVEVTVAEGEVVVRDHGPGISAGDAPRVFDRFWRASTARHLPGSGLGLAIVKDVAEAHGGSVALEHPTGGGARFRLRLGGLRA